MADSDAKSTSFLEESESLAVEADSGTDARAVRSFSRGRREPGRSVAEPPRPGPPRLDEGPALDLVRRILGESAAVPGLWVEVIWVASHQEVTIRRQGLPEVRESRRGERVRLDGRLTRRGRSGIATVEAVLPADPGALVAALARRAEERTDAGPAPEGGTAVVFAPGAGGLLAHELIGHALEADTVLAGGSWLAGFEGGRGSEVGVVDDPRRGRVAWHVDDEGEPARPTQLMRRGCVSGWLHDRRTAREAGRPTTGHGRRASFREPVRPRMGCTFVQPGRLEPEEVLRSVSEGVYVRRMESAGTDPLTGRAVFRVGDSDLIRRGGIDRPLRPHLLLLDGREAIPNTRLIAKDLAFDRCIGSCHRDGQTLSTSVGAPTFCIDSGAVIF